MIINGINDAVYGLMMVMDGVTGRLSNSEYAVTIKSIIQLEKNGETIQEIDTFKGDGMCMVFTLGKRTILVTRKIILLSKNNNRIIIFIT